MDVLDALSAALLVLGGVFFLTGTVGLLRFPGAFARLHALTKADNLGLGCVVLALMLQAESLWVAAKLLLIWLLALVAATVSAHLIARFSLRAQGGVRRTPP
ncbi:cation:proton antiporter [Halorhodospira halophila]|uniref:Multisubunit sodium/proton antiporter, MrpG subunit n=1 Tax=Halorhodospira halophila (strain DSM 244 / SL1) TaxID=349124 RepID=A1WV80_HALHL|nr:monovalent cation/H(+) antiporter subunit G [Halorhodospira halophila]ABM61592.1 multisubunit sodium/proton antiporter, MrpG subunit [Halorhodospira halophila SL1]MBK1729950.1 Na+/H+ antiporter subunit G [Halorhodospira halophila]